MPEGGSGGKPADFFVGLVDFFSILLPGAMLTFCLYKCIEHRQPDVLNQLPGLPEGWATIAAFVLVAYVLGHLLFVIGSLCLDPIYDWWKESFRVVKGRAIWEVLWKPWAEREELKEEADTHLRFGEIGTDFHRLIRFVRLRSSEAAAEMDHLEADHKFFRSLILVLLLAWPLLLWSYYRQDGLYLWAGLVLLLVPMVPFSSLLEDRWRKKRRDKSLSAEGRLVVHEVSVVGRRTGANKETWALKDSSSDSVILWSLKDSSGDFKDKYKLANIQLVVLFFLFFLFIAWFVWTVAPVNNPPGQAHAAPIVTEKKSPDQTQATPPASSISITAFSGTMSVTATAEHKKSETNATPPPPGWVATSLGLGIALSFVRYFQQRLKYSKIAYRTFLVLAESPPEDH